MFGRSLHSSADHLLQSYGGRALQGFTSSALLHNTVALPIPNAVHFESNIIGLTLHFFCSKNLHISVKSSIFAPGLQPKSAKIVTRCPANPLPSNKLGSFFIVNFQLLPIFAKKIIFFAFFHFQSKVIGLLFCIFAQNFKTMFLYAIIIGAIIWTIYLTWRTYKVTGVPGFAFIVLLFCIGATPFVAWLLLGHFLKD